MRGMRICVGCALAIAGALRAQPAPGEVFDQAWMLVRDEFYDESLGGLDWAAVGAELSPRADGAESPAALSAVINDALSRLGASHTRHYHPGQARFYELLDIFNPDGLDEGEHPFLPAGRVTYVGIGIDTAEAEGRLFVADVCETGPAHAAGLLPGDEIVGVEGGPWRDADSFRDREGVETVVSIRREGPEAPVREITVIPRRIMPREVFLASSEAGACVVERGGSRVAYVRMRSYAHREFHELVTGLITGEFAGADGLVLDIRGGWGGANPEYLAIRNPLAPEFGLRFRGGEWTSYRPAWHGPFVLLIDEGSRSGKEIFAYALKEHGAATLVGARTAGAVLGGRPYILSDGSVLYLAVADGRVDGHVRLEGVGVEPDIGVERDLPYCGGRDPQREAAIEEAARLAATPPQDP